MSNLQNALNLFLYFTIAVYGFVFAVNFVLTTAKTLSKQNTEEEEDTITSEIKFVTPTTVRDVEKLIDAYQIPFKAVTIAQMKEYIEKYDIKKKVELQLNKKLTRARKREIYNALQTIYV